VNISKLIALSLRQASWVGEIGFMGLLVRKHDFVSNVVCDPNDFFLETRTWARILS